MKQTIERAFMKKIQENHFVYRTVGFSHTNAQEAIAIKPSERQLWSWISFINIHQGKECI